MMTQGEREGEGKRKKRGQRRKQKKKKKNEAAFEMLFGWLGGWLTHDLPKLRQGRHGMVMPSKCRSSLPFTILFAPCLFRRTIGMAPPLIYPYISQRLVFMDTRLLLP
jgi:hypothetical protein